VVVLLNSTFVDRSEAKVDIEDRGYQFGDGIYEVIRVYDGKFFELKQHIDRLFISAKAIELVIPHQRTELNGLLEDLIKRNNVSTGYVYLQYTRGEAPRSHPFPAESKAVLSAYTNVKPRPIKMMKHGMNVITAEDVRWMLCHIKSLNLLGAVLANQKAKSLGKDEAILHREGIVTECSLSNCFIVKNNTLYTHPANNMILNGITRQVVIELAKKDGMAVVEERFVLEVLMDADEVFASGTTIEVMPIVSIDDKPIGDGTPGAMTSRLQELFETRIKADM
jgi:D-alanine transaminase